MNPVASPKHYAVIAAALLGLLGLTIAAAFLNLGAFNTPVALAIALAKAVLILLCFMHLRRGNPLVRLFALAGFFWLGILLVLTLNDYFARG